jgi:hypothetical protein
MHGFPDFRLKLPIIRDELFNEEMSLPMKQEKMGEAFRAAILRAIGAGQTGVKPMAVSLAECSGGHPKHCHFALEKLPTNPPFA